MMRLRIFFVIYAPANLGFLAYGVLALLNPGALLDSFTVRVYVFPKDATTAVNHLTALFRLVGLFNVIL